MALNDKADKAPNSVLGSCSHALAGGGRSTMSILLPGSGLRAGLLPQPHPCLTVTPSKLLQDPASLETEST